jgi:hypothetical protein
VALNCFDGGAGAGVALEVAVHRLDRQAQRPQLAGRRGVEGRPAPAADVAAGLGLGVAHAIESFGHDVRGGRVQDPALLGGEPAVGPGAGDEHQRAWPQVDVGHQMRAVDVKAVGVDPADKVLHAVEPIDTRHLGREPHRAGAECSHDGIGDT